MPRGNGRRKPVAVAEAAFKNEKEAQERMNEEVAEEVKGEDMSRYDNRPLMVKNDLDTVGLYCDRVEIAIENELKTSADTLRRHLKDLKRERTSILETLAENQAKVTRINQTLQNAAFRMENERSLNSVEIALEE